MVARSMPDCPVRTTLSEHYACTLCFACRVVELTIRLSSCRAVRSISPAERASADEQRDMSCGWMDPEGRPLRHYAGHDALLGVQAVLGFVVAGSAPLRAVEDLVADLVTALAG